MFVYNFVSFATVFVLCNALSSNRDGQSVVERMKVDQDKVVESAVNGTYYNAKNVQLLQFMHANFKSLPQNTRTQAFKWSSCGSSSDLLVVNGLTVTPDPLRMPGTIGFKFDVTIQDTFTSPLKLVIELKKYEGFFWLPIPCIDDRGSCTYDNVCQKLAGITCPKEFSDKIPCKCPFTKGSYSLPSSSFSVPVHVPSGKYYVQAKLTYGSRAVNCIEIYFNVA